MTARAGAKGFRRGAYIGLTGDTTSLKRMRREVQKRDTVAEAWTSVDRAINQARRKTFTGQRTIQER